MRADPITFVVAGEPVAKGRPRMTRGGVAYTPAQTRKYEAHARMAAQTEMAGRPLIAGAVRVSVLVELPIPASWSGKKSAAALLGLVRPTRRPDIDNFVKAALDALNGIVVPDDSAVVEIAAAKKYGPQPKLVVTVSPLEHEP